MITTIMAGFAFGYCVMDIIQNYRAKLAIEEVDGPYRIDEYDGFESVETPGSYDWIIP